MGGLEVIQENEEDHNISRYLAYFYYIILSVGCKFILTELQFSAQNLRLHISILYTSSSLNIYISKETIIFWAYFNTSLELSQHKSGNKFSVINKKGMRLCLLNSIFVVTNQ